MLLVEDYRVRISTQDERWRFQLLSIRSSNLKRRDIYMMGRKEKRVRGTDQPWQAFAAGQLQGLSSNPDRPFGVESVTVLRIKVKTYQTTQGAWFIRELSVKSYYVLITAFNVNSGLPYSSGVLLLDVVLKAALSPLQSTSHNTMPR